MLNPNEVASAKFDRVMGRGYRAEDVDHYLRQLSDEIRKLIEDKEDLEQKLLVLADKLEEYRKDEESMRSALIGAQKLGDSVIRDAKAKASIIIDEANGKAELLINTAKQTIEREQGAYIRMKREVATFKSKLQLLYKQHLELISTLPSEEERLPIENVKQTLRPDPDEPAEDIIMVGQTEALPEEHSDEAYLEEELLEYSEETGELLPEEDFELEPEVESRRESRFGPLKFGREFDVRREDKRKK